MMAINLDMFKNCNGMDVFGTSDQGSQGLLSLIYMLGDTVDDIIIPE
jgi:hypothetical protein